MSFPIEVWGLMFSFLPLNDVIEVSALCKDFYCETKKKIIKKLSYTRRLYRSERTVYEYYAC